MISVEPGLAPGGLLFILYDRDDRELHRFPVDSDAALSLPIEEFAAVVESHARSVMVNGGLVRIFDGDSGEIVAALQ